MTYEDLIRQNRKNYDEVKSKYLDALHANDIDKMNLYKAQLDSYAEEYLKFVKDK